MHRSLAFCLDDWSAGPGVCLELMEIGHMALHGAYDHMPGLELLDARRFEWKAPIDEASWRAGHNHRHHGYANIEGRDPDLDFAGLRLSPRVRYRRLHRLQPLSNLFTWFGFATMINLHVTGMIDVYLRKGAPLSLPDRGPGTQRAAKRAFWSKTLHYYGREYIFFALLAGPFFWKPLLGNVLSEVGRDLCSAAVIYCGHVGAARSLRACGRFARGMACATGARAGSAPCVTWRGSYGAYPCRTR